jgi:hypothetical protein
MTSETKEKKQVEEKPHWRTKTTISFTQSDELRFQRLLSKADKARPGITKSQLVRIGLIHLESLSREKFDLAIEQTPEPRKGFERQTDNPRFEMTDTERRKLQNMIE